MEAPSEVGNGVMSQWPVNLLGSSWGDSQTYIVLVGKELQGVKNRDLGTGEMTQ